MLFSIFYLLVVYTIMYYFCDRNRGARGTRGGHPPTFCCRCSFLRRSKNIGLPNPAATRTAIKIWWPNHRKSHVQISSFQNLANPLGPLWMDRAFGSQTCPFPLQITLCGPCTVCWVSSYLGNKWKCHRILWLIFELYYFIFTILSKIFFSDIRQIRHPPG